MSEKARVTLPRGLALLTAFRSYFDIFNGPGEVDAQSLKHILLLVGFSLTPAQVEDVLLSADVDGEWLAALRGAPRRRTVPCPEPAGRCLLSRAAAVTVKLFSVRFEQGTPSCILIEPWILQIMQQILVPGVEAP